MDTVTRGSRGKSRLGDPSTRFTCSGQAERLGERAKPKANLPQCGEQVLEFILRSAFCVLRSAFSTL